MSYACNLAAKVYSESMETEYKNYFWISTLGVGESKEDELCTTWNGVEVEVRCICEDGEDTFVYRIHSINWDAYKAAFPKHVDNCFDDVEDRLYWSDFRDDTDECHKIAEEYLRG